MCSVAGLERFKEVAEIRQDEVYLQTKDNWKEIQTGMWHQNCYKKYTSQTNVDSFLKRKAPEPSIARPVLKEILHSPLRTRKASGINGTDWGKCVICQNITKKGDKTLSRIMTVAAAETLLHAAESRKDSKVLLRIRGEDLIAVRAKYHRRCYMSYTSHLQSKNVVDVAEDDKYNNAFYKLLNEIHHPIFIEMKAISMASLCQRYRELLNDDASANYRTEKLKKRLKNHYGDNISFHVPTSPTVSELVYSSMITLHDALQAIHTLNDELQDFTMEDSVQPYNDISESSQFVDDSMTTLFHAVQVLRKDLQSVKQGIATDPVNPEHLTSEKASEIIPDSLYAFLHLLLESERGLENIDLKEPKHKSESPQLHRQILSVGQDILHIMSRGIVKTPKHVGLAVTVRHMTGSKLLVTILNRYGHCCSYDGLERIETALATEQLKQMEMNDGIAIYGKKA